MNHVTPLTGQYLTFRRLPKRSRWWHRPVAGAIGVICLTLSPIIHAVTPAPDGGYSGANTAEGTNSLFSLTDGVDNTAIGFQTLFKDTSGFGNTAIGYVALGNNTTGFDNTATGFNALGHNTTGQNNTATGVGALAVNTTASSNTADGFNALFGNTTGAQNTATGFEALSSNTNGSDNTATGYQALFNNGFDAMDNTAVGSGALFSNVSASFNTAIGFNALFKNTASNNTAVGDQALLNNTSGTENTATGAGTLFKNTTGNNNTADGLEALFSNTTGSNNTADGLLALENNIGGHDNIAVGFQALKSNTTGVNNVALGSNAGSNLTTGSNNIDIGAPGVAAEANTIRIGKSGTQQKTFIAGISGKTVASGVGVIVDVNGHLGTVTSSARFKDEIKPMDKASEAILALKPVTFRYKKELDPDGIPQFGLVAEQVEKVNPDLVARDADGKVNTVRYEAVNAMLLNEFLKEHRTVLEQNRKIQEQETTITQLKKGMETVVAHLKEQDSKIQRVSAQLKVSKAAPQMVADNQ